MEAESPSTAIAEIYEKQAPRLRDCSRRNRLRDRRVGALFAIDGRVVRAQVFGSREALAKNFQKIIESYALDASMPACRHSKVRKRDAEKLLQQAARCRVRSYPSVGLGTGIRIESARMLGFALEIENRLLHLAIFVKADGARRPQPQSSRLARFSRRRQRLTE